MKNESSSVTVRQRLGEFNSGNGDIQEIVVGVDALPVTVRHLAHLIIRVKDGSTSRFLGTCTATVIRRRWLMTAAHCFPRTAEIAFDETFAFVGEARRNTQIPSSNTEPYFVDRVLVHKGFKPEQNDARNDIALVRLNRRIPSQDFSKVKLPRRKRNDPKPGEKVRADRKSVV